MRGTGRLAPLPAADRTGAVARALASFIDESRLRPGERLPTERSLMQSLAVGRSTVREVIRQFQARGIVESRKGSGTFLLRPVSAEAVHAEKGTAGREDLAFHLSIYDATGNPPFHRELFDAIRRRDGSLAREKTCAILAVVEEDIGTMAP